MHPQCGWKQETQTVPSQKSPFSLSVFHRAWGAVRLHAGGIFHFDSRPPVTSHATEAQAGTRQLLHADVVTVLRGSKAPVGAGRVPVPLGEVRAPSERAAGTRSRLSVRGGGHRINPQISGGNTEQLRSRCADGPPGGRTRKTSARGFSSSSV